jgi:hypothetical protein
MEYYLFRSQKKKTCAYYVVHTISIASIEPASGGCLYRTGEPPRRMLQPTAERDGICVTMHGLDCSRL